MKINTHYFLLSSLSFLKEKLPSINPAQQKISSVVFLIFACLLTSFLVGKHYFFKARKIRNLTLSRMIIQKGESQKGELCGYLKVLLPDGSTIEGLYKNNHFYDHVKTTLSSGFIIEGTVDESLRLHGQGSMMSYLDGKRIEGEFENGKLITGEITIPNNSQQKGEFKNYKLNGYGEEIYSDGTVLEGYFTDDDLTVGSITYVNGFRQEGKFESAKLNGRGKMTIPDKAIMEGEFKDGQLNGFATITYSNGKIIKGKFKDGELISDED